MSKSDDQLCYKILIDILTTNESINKVIGNNPDYKLEIIDVLESILVSKITTVSEAKKLYEDCDDFYNKVEFTCKLKGEKVLVQLDDSNYSVAANVLLFNKNNECKKVYRYIQTKTKSSIVENNIYNEYIIKHECITNDSKDKFGVVYNINNVDTTKYPVLFDIKDSYLIPFDNREFCYRPLLIDGKLVDSLCVKPNKTTYIIDTSTIDFEFPNYISLLSLSDTQTNKKVVSF